MNQNGKLLTQLQQDWYSALQDLAIFYSSDDAVKELPEKQIIRELEKLSLKLYKQTTVECLILSGPSGVGKGTVARFLEEKGIKRLVRDTTRKRRPAEIEGRDYHFVGVAEFQKQQIAGKYIATGQTYGDWRGLPKDSVFAMIRASTPFYIEGSARTSRYFLENPDSKVQNVKFANVFLLPPSFNELCVRLIEREREKINDEVEKRIREAIEHLKKAQVSVNGRFVVDIFLINPTGDAEIAASRIRKLLIKE